MHEKNKNGNWEFGIFATIGVVAAATGMDLTGRLMHFLYGEWKYVCIGLVVVAFCGISVYVHSQFEDTQWIYQKNIEQKLREYEHIASNLRYENRTIRDEIEFIRKCFGDQVRLCEKTIQKVETLLEQQTPIIIQPEEAELEQVDQNVSDAVEEMIGGVL